MSGVKVGTRLEQLETLYARVGHELKAERLAVARGQSRTPGGFAPRVTSSDIIMDRLEARRPAPLPPAAVIRQWAWDNGYLPEDRRTGPIPAEVCDLYREQVMS